MNRTQKAALFNLAIMVFCIGVLVYLFDEIFVLKRMPERSGGLCVLIAYCLLMAISFVLLRRKQSPHEVEADERDDLIKKRAVLVSFVSVWVLLYAASIVPRFVVGDDGTVPVWMLPFINLGVFFITMLIYGVTILVQYGWGGKDGK